MSVFKRANITVLLQSGLDEKWWADSMECYCHLRDIQDLLSDWKTPYERRFGDALKGPTTPFGVLVEYHLVSGKDQQRILQFGLKVLPSIFLGYAMYAGGIWKVDILVTDVEELEEMDASGIHANRLNTKEVVTPTEGENFVFPVADGSLKIAGGDQVLRTST